MEKIEVAAVNPMASMQQVKKKNGKHCHRDLT